MSALNSRKIKPPPVLPPHLLQVCSPNLVESLNHLQIKYDIGFIDPELCNCLDARCNRFYGLDKTNSPPLKIFRENIFLYFQVILNKDTPLVCEPTLLPTPNHVMVNHVYALSIKDNVIVMSSTSRFKKKYVTTVLYKPI